MRILLTFFFLFFSTETFATPKANVAINTKALCTDLSSGKSSQTFNRMKAHERLQILNDAIKKQKKNKICIEAFQTEKKKICSTALKIKERFATELKQCKCAVNYHAATNAIIIGPFTKLNLNDMAAYSKICKQKSQWKSLIKLGQKAKRNGGIAAPPKKKLSKKQLKKNATKEIKGMADKGLYLNAYSKIRELKPQFGSKWEKSMYDYISKKKGVKKKSKKIKKKNCPFDYKSCKRACLIKYRNHRKGLDLGYQTCEGRCWKKMTRCQ